GDRRAEVTVRLDVVEPYRHEVPTGRRSRRDVGLREPARLVVQRAGGPRRHVDLPARLTRPSPGGETGDQLPRTLRLAHGVPRDIRDIADGQAVQHEVAQLRGVLRAADGEAAGLLHHPAAFGEHRALVALDVLHRQAGG